MAADAIIMHCLFPFFFYKDDLGLPAQCENSGMPESIFTLEIIFIEYIVLRNMTIVAMGCFAMRTVAPGSILGSHDMAICASRGMIR